MSTIVNPEMKWFDIPYEEDGRSINGADCLGVVNLWYKDKLDISVLNDNEVRIKNFLEVKEKNIQPHDVILFEISNDKHHVGIYLGGNRFLHQLEYKQPVVSKFHIWKRKVKSIYRHESLI